jgi:hypothetical protein
MSSFPMVSGEGRSVRRSAPHCFNGRITLAFGSWILHAARYEFAELLGRPAKWARHVQFSSEDLSLQVQAGRHLRRRVRPPFPPTVTLSVLLGQPCPGDALAG